MGEVITNNQSNPIQEAQTVDKQALLRQQYRVLGSGLGVTELRTFQPHAKTYFSTSEDEFVEQALPLLEKDLFIGINPRKDTKPGTYESVSHLTCLVLDLDPIRTTDASTEEQHKSAIDLGDRILRDIPGGFKISSGSGCHVYYPIEPIKVENWQELANSVKEWGEGFQRKYDTQEIKIDSIFDLPRVIRVWGSFNSKSKRQCSPLQSIGEYRRSNIPFKQQRELIIVNGSIITGERNSTLFNYAISLIKQNQSKEDVISFTKAKNQECRPPLAERELDALIHSALRYAEVPKAVDTNIRKADSAYFDSLKNRSMGVLTGIPQLDEMISGLKPQKLYIIAARPTSGKTTIITQILTNICEKGHSALFFPTEVGAEPIYDKIVSRRAGIDLRKFQNGTFEPGDVKRIEEIRAYLESLKLTIVEDFSVTVDKIEYAIKKYDPDFVAIDYIQAFAFNDPESVAEKGETVRRLKELAVKYNKPIILASQLNRGDGKRNLRQLKGTGALEEFGDVIAFLETVDRLNYPRKVDLDIMKSKYSETGVISLKFYSSQCKFEVDTMPGFKPQ